MLEKSKRVRERYKRQVCKEKESSENRNRGLKEREKETEWSEQRKSAREV